MFQETIKSILDGGNFIENTFSNFSGCGDGRGRGSIDGGGCDGGSIFIEDGGCGYGYGSGGGFGYGRGDGCGYGFRRGSYYE